MENASKALIIAGAILLSILIIALGVFIFNQAKGAVGKVNLSEQEVAAFNSKFEQYKGRQLGSNVKALISDAKTYNDTADEDYVKVTLDSVGSGKGSFVQTKPTVYPTVSAGSKYIISYDYATSGKICEIYINEEK